MAFTPLASLVGGVLIGTSASLLLALEGRIAGISGIVSGILRPERAGDSVWRGAFLGGLLAGGVLLSVVAPSSVAHTDVGVPLASVAAAGLLVGFGTRLGGGCTSGHGVCGTSRLSKRSIVATLVFMATGFAAATVVQKMVAP